VADQKKPRRELITMIDLTKPPSQMTAQELEELARHVAGQIRAKVPRPEPEP